MEDERDAEQCFGIDFGDEHSADPMRDSYSYHLICGMMILKNACHIF